MADANQEQIKFKAAGRILDLTVKEIGEEGVIDVKVRLTPMKPDQLIGLAKLKVAHDVTLAVTFDGKFSQRELFAKQDEKLPLPGGAS